MAHLFAEADNLIKLPRDNSPHLGAPAIARQADDLAIELMSLSASELFPDSTTGLIRLFIERALG